MVRVATVALALWLCGCHGGPPTPPGCPDGGAATCASDGKSVIRCVNGLEVVVLVCADTQVCDGATCKETICPASSGFCDGDVADSCNASGTQETRTDCAAVGQVCITDAKGARCVAQQCMPGT